LLRRGDREPRHNASKKPKTKLKNLPGTDCAEKKEVGGPLGKKKGGDEGRVGDVRRVGGTRLQPGLKVHKQIAGNEKKTPSCKRDRAKRRKKKSKFE